MSGGLVVTRDNDSANVEDFPGPSGSRSSDFKGVVEQRRGSGSQQLPEVRIARIETIHRTLQGLHDEWEERKKMTFAVDHVHPSYLCSSSSDHVSCVELEARERKDPLRFCYLGCKSMYVVDSILV
ncbi:hypothetical protein KIN20_016323 [Parelaphostrongylus tenuis]|uniref:Uncharacterized protein n=1 Tax=Parelaphostrongylus tenuis TaxID=148309 RepID=A0AAD5MG95_PARTN|nr:hypothetical protein KIN20_016323 [Parelaphostrongylus tenuis]